MKNPFDISSLETSMANYDKTETPEFSTIPDSKRPFSFNLSKEKIKRLRSIVAIRRRNPSFFHYNNSQALREAVAEMRVIYPVTRRPKAVKNPIRSGRPYLLNDKEQKLKTSFIISEADREYIYDFIYAHAQEYDFFGKERFFEYVLETLEDKYKKEQSK